MPPRPAPTVPTVGMFADDGWCCPDCVGLMEATFGARPTRPAKPRYLNASCGCPDSAVMSLTADVLDGVDGDCDWCGDRLADPPVSDSDGDGDADWKSLLAGDGDDLWAEVADAGFELASLDSLDSSRW